MFVWAYDICECFLTNYGYLIFLLISFIINSPFVIFVPCGCYLWWSQTFVCGSRMTTVEYEKWDSFVELPSRCDDVGIICECMYTWFSWCQNKNLTRLIWFKINTRLFQQTKPWFKISSTSSLASKRKVSSHPRHM